MKRHQFCSNEAIQGIAYPWHAGCVRTRRAAVRNPLIADVGAFSEIGRPPQSEDRKLLKRMPDFFGITIAAQPREIFLGLFLTPANTIRQAITPNNARCDDTPITWPKPPVEAQDLPIPLAIGIAWGNDHGRNSE